MNNLARLLLFLPTLIFLLSACHPTRKLGSNDLRPRSEKYLMKRLVQQQIDADWFSARYKATYSDEQEVVKFSGYLRMAKDSLIWLNVRKLNVEAARVLITPDSFFVIDRLNNEYLARDFTFLKQQFQLPVNFRSMQQLILGNPVFFTRELTAGILDQQYLLDGKTERFQTRYLLQPEPFALAGIRIEEPSRQQSLNATYADYQALDEETIFSYLRIIEVEATELGQARLSLDLSKVELNVPKTIRFEIPDRYTEIK